MTSILITGGAGFLGSLICHRLVKSNQYERIVILSRDWHKHTKLREELNDDGRFRWFIGDIRDKDRLIRAFNGIDCIIHLAAIKDAIAGERDPREILLTNCVGTQLVIEAAIDCGVKKVLVVSSDKSASPLNGYGKSKALAESLAIAANSYSPNQTIFSCARYGNVVSSSSSVIPLFKRQAEKGELTLTDKRMTRYWILPEVAVSFVLECLARMEGGEIFIPHLKRAGIIDIANAISSEAEKVEIGIRPGEKVHEVLLAPEEMSHTVDLGWGYRIEPMFHFWSQKGYSASGIPVTDYANFTSASAPELTTEELKNMVEYTQENKHG